MMSSCGLEMFPTSWHGSHRHHIRHPAWNAPRQRRQVIPGVELYVRGGIDCESIWTSRYPHLFCGKVRLPWIFKDCPRVALRTRCGAGCKGKGWSTGFRESGGELLIPVDRPSSTVHLQFHRGRWTGIMGKARGGCKMPIEQETAVFHGRLKNFLLHFEITLRLSNVLSWHCWESKMRRDGSGFLEAASSFMVSQPSIRPSLDAGTQSSHQPPPHVHGPKRV
jgi:hypothetical protein